MAIGENNQSLTCESCSATLSWPIVRGLTTKRDRRIDSLYCPACRSPMGRIDVEAMQP
ncbi:hypothetical protein SAMN04487950_2180 [Halogranum rubrum]|uniref:Uncharacterized protein n=1 Tax=Halogranum rubrum TaxID=553466 RepID=A0A1I4EH71_9EURY|nr:hypothetical protein SAMN04487950_2180 [Halogranum rubrum]